MSYGTLVRSLLGISLALDVTACNGTDQSRPAVDAGRPPVPPDSAGAFTDDAGGQRCNDDAGSNAVGTARCIASGCSIRTLAVGEHPNDTMVIDATSAYWTDSKAGTLSKV